MRSGAQVLRGLRATVAALPDGLQQRARSFWNACQIRLGRFASPEPEFALLERWVGEGDWALDVGANIGHYTLRLSKLVGSAGRVIALEPVPETFAILADNCRTARCRNVTLINAAASGRTAVVTMSIPNYEDGLKNFYQARIEQGAAAREGLAVLAIPVDSLDLPARLALVKIDAEGHERFVLEGLRRTLERSRPVIIMENSDGQAVELLASLDYRMTSFERSPNVVGIPAERMRESEASAQACTPAARRA
mgnify:CR=1 FL=1